MPDLILRPSGKEAPKDWSLQLRFHDALGETGYQTLARVNEDTARNIVRAGAAFWLFGEPDDEKSGRPRLCVECGLYYADYPSPLCSGCEAYREHTAV